MKREREIKVDTLFMALGETRRGAKLFRRRRQRGNKRRGLLIGPVNDHEKATIAEQHPEVAKMCGFGDLVPKTKPKTKAAT